MTAPVALRSRWLLGVALVATLALAVAKPAALPAAPAAPATPAALYARHCLLCHGERGDGAGPAARFLDPAPRDFTRGRFKWRSTASGEAPTTADLVRAIRHGAPGTAMPGYNGILDDGQLVALAEFVKSFAPARFARAAVPLVLELAPIDQAALLAPADRSALLARGETLFAASCARCHGLRGAGDGPAAATLEPAPPFDLTRLPLRRGESSLASIATTIATGLDGTAMPAFAFPGTDLLAVAAWVDTLRFRGDFNPPSPPPITRPSGGSPGLELAPQGDPPAALAPAARSLSSAQCGRCHAKQLREWRDTRHARTASPGTRAQFIGAADSFVRSCLRCHAPLAEQLPGATGFDERLLHEGVTCAACHLRDHVRQGPPRRADSGLLALPSYPFVEDAAYERADFCLPCHQLRAEDAVAGRPLLDTYREWLHSPYMPRGVQCQHCHMPDREHTFKGVHDPETVRQGLDVRAAATRATDRVSVRVTLANVGAGHYLPTTPKPAALVDVEMLDARGATLPDAAARGRIGRRIAFDGKWRELEDTRIPPGGTRVLEHAFAGAARAQRARVTVTMAPDDFYEGFYERSLQRSGLAPEARALFLEALTEARAARFVVTRFEVAIDAAP